MALEMKQSQRMTQDLRMTPQLQQAIKLLQLSRLELVDVIQQEMVENPFLEELSDVHEGPGPDPIEAAIEPSSDFEAQVRSPEEQARGERAVADIDWESYLENYSAPLPGASGGSGGEEMPGVDQTLTKAENLSDHLLWQLGMMDATDREKRLAEVIVCNLDEIGYLSDTTLEDLALQHEATYEEMEEALLMVQELDPTGVGSRNLSECLLIQARLLCPHDVLLRRVIQDHLHDLEKKNYAGIARALNATKQEIMDVHRQLMHFDPKPGRQFVDVETTYITPDIYIVKQGEDWIPILNDDGLPRLRVSKYYQRALGTGGDREAKNYVQDKLRSAWWLIRSIQQRQRTIIRVAESIIKFQRDFFEFGIDHLRPLVLREVAEDIGMHESTISRVTTNKYVHTPRGIYELKFFFNSSIKKEFGEDIAAESVKHRIKAIVSEERPARPYSDQQLVEILAERYQIEIARRTVAKYREELGILASSRRKTLL